MELRNSPNAFEARVEQALQRAYQPEGLNIGVNIAHAGGAGIPGHLHIHLLPRWTGDTNFMTTVAHARVLPEDLTESFDHLAAALKALAPAPGAKDDRNPDGR